MKSQGSNITPKHVYNILNKNRGIFLSEVLRIYNVDDNKKQIVQNKLYRTNQLMSFTKSQCEQKISVSYKIIVSAEK